MTWKHFGKLIKLQKTWHRKTGWEDFSDVVFFVIWVLVVYVGWREGWNGWMKFGTIGSLGGFGFVK